MPKLGIQGLPGPVENLASGGLYGLAADMPSIRVPILARTAEESIAAGHRVVVASSEDITAYLKRARIAGCDLARLARQGLLNILRQRSEDHPETALQRLLGELRYFKLPEKSLLIVDLADELLQCNSPALLKRSLEAIDHWAESAGHTVLLVFSLSGLGPKGFSNLKAAADRFTGFAVVRSSEDDAILSVRHWFGLKGLAARSSFALAADGEGRVQARATATAGRLGVELSREALLVTKRASEDFGAQAGQWKVVESALEALEILRQSLAGTVVLHFQRHGELRDLAQSVAAIRSLGRPQIRVVVRECGARLRTGQLVALFRLGVSVVVPQGVSGTAARLMAESLSGSLVTRGFETDVKKALSESRVEFRGGPLQAGEFSRAVEQLLEAASEMDLPCTLVIMTPQTALASKAALSSVRGSLRDAVFTENEDGLWVFLFGCAPESAQTVMTRLLGARFENLLVGWRRLSGPREILPTLTLLVGNHSHEPRNVNLVTSDEVSLADLTKGQTPTAS